MDSIISISLLAIAAMLNGVMDVIRHRFNQSWLDDIHGKLNLFAFDFKREWFLSEGISKYDCWGKALKLFGVIPFPPIWDAWHCAKAAMLVLIGVNLTFFAGRGGQWWYLLPAYSVAWWAGFNFVYEFALIKPAHRRNYFKVFWWG